MKMNSKPQEELGRYSEFVDWLRATAIQAEKIRLKKVDTDSNLMESILENDALDIARDLDGIFDSACLIRNGLSNLLSLKPNTGDLESALSEIEVDLAHAVSHWDSTLALLRSKYDWLASIAHDHDGESFEQ